MDIARLFRSCRLGDLESVRYLIEERDIDINIKDKWNSSPLYYACLCGHIELVRYLLANGARCDAKTFDGERCVYGALTNEIRKVLVNDYKVISKKLIQRNDYDEFLRKALEVGRFYDAIFKIHNSTFRVHKCIVTARCDYFDQMFRTKWKNREVVHINHPKVTADAFQILLYYLYTGNLELNLNIKDDVLKLLRQCKLEYEHQIILERLQDSKIAKSKSKISSILIELPVKEDYYKLYSACKQSANNVLSNGDSNDIPQENYINHYSDIVFKVNDQYFPCHKLFFSERSDFFNALIQDHFYESNETFGDIAVYELTDICTEAFDALLCYVYTNSTFMLSIEVAFELLLRSDLYLFNSLKKHCANIIGEYISHLNPVDLIKLARNFSLPKLESTAIEYISNNLEQYIESEDFKELVISDAKNIKERQETDTIDIIDDLRFYLTSYAKNDIGKKLEYINSLLESLQLFA